MPRKIRHHSAQFSDKQGLRGNQLWRNTVTLLKGFQSNLRHVMTFKW